MKRLFKSFRTRFGASRKFVVLGDGSKFVFDKLSLKPGCHVTVGQNSIVEAALSFDRDNAKISIGDRTFIGASHLVCAEQITIGNDVLMAWGCTVADHNSHSIHWAERQRDVVQWAQGKKDWSHVAMKPVSIQDKSWIGFNVIILKGVTIGEGAVVGAGSVVTKDVAPYTVVAGNPAAVIKELPCPAAGDKEKFQSWEQAVIWLKTQPQYQALVKDSYYDDPLEQAAERFYQSSEWRAVQKLLAGRAEGLALDLGAGRGIASYALAKDGFTVTAVEPDPSNLVGSGAIRQLGRIAGLNFVVAENYGESLPFADNYFDVVYERQVLHHAQNLPQLCREIYRVLKPGGIFIGAREHVISRKADLDAFLQEHPLHWLYGGENAYLLKDYQNSLRRGGFANVRTLARLDSEINLFPSTRAEAKRVYDSKLKFRTPNWLFRLLVKYLNYRDSYPGRLYSFIAYK